MRRGKKTYSIQPEDKRADVMLTLKVPAALKGRIDAYASDLNSSPEYTVRTILTQHLDREGVAEKEKASAVSAVA